MKTQVPDPVLRDAMAAAARRGVSLKVFLTEALREKLVGPERGGPAGWPVPPPKLQKGGKTHPIHVDKEFSRIDSEDWK